MQKLLIESMIYDRTNVIMVKVTLSVHQTSYNDSVCQKQFRIVSWFSFSSIGGNVIIFTKGICNCSLVSVSCLYMQQCLILKYIVVTETIDLSKLINKLIDMINAQPASSICVHQIISRRLEFKIIIKLNSSCDKYHLFVWIITNN